ncbi:MAG: desulfoferrodoxin [Sedimentisphaerales bacterium]|nr:desulfoferrodoxin [Sedimentisphaerales bacterium]
MAEKLGIYRCNVCGNMVEVVRSGGGELVCCGQPMEHLVAKTADQGKEKHVPVIEKVDGGVKVKVGSIPHPMEEKHYIEWIEVLLDGQSYRQFLRPGQAPEAVFALAGGTLTAREFCNVHGLWEGK